MLNRFILAASTAVLVCVASPSLAQTRTQTAEPRIAGGLLTQPPADPTPLTYARIVECAALFSTLAALPESSQPEPRMTTLQSDQYARIGTGMSRVARRMSPSGDAAADSAIADLSGQLVAQVDTGGLYPDPDDDSLSLAGSFDILVARGEIIAEWWPAERACARDFSL